MADHPFIKRPHRTLLTLSFPVLLSLIAEPLTGLVDTAFVADLGAVPLAALGVGTITLSSVFWVFNFLGIGTQTEVAQALGKGNGKRARQIAGLAVTLSIGLGLLFMVLAWPFLGQVAQLMGAEGAITTEAVHYMRYRLLGTPAVLATLTAFGVFRGQQDMKTPLWLAVGVNGLNIVLDWALIPSFGVAGAAIASSMSQWLGGGTAVYLIFHRLGLPSRLPVGEMGKLLKIGGDLFIRTGALTLFLLYATRVATQAGAEAGASHQAIRQMWGFTALFLDAFAITGQSLIGYFVADTKQVKRVARIVCGWSLLTGFILWLVLWLGEGVVVRLLVPETAVSLFKPAYLISLLFLPISALSFATDGIHWGTSDFAFLRNVVLLATAVSSIMLWFIDPQQANALNGIWWATGIWLTVRALFGILRIWPGIGDAPLGKHI